MVSADSLPSQFYCTLVMFTYLRSFFRYLEILVEDFLFARKFAGFEGYLVLVTD
jgi:hypothetical protein